MTTLGIKWSLISIIKKTRSILVREMNMGRKNNELLKGKILYTILILLIFLLGKGIPLYMIDVNAYTEKQMNAESLFLHTLGSDLNQCSIFALGISPYMISSVLVQVLYSLRGTDYKKKTSPIKINRLIMHMTLLVSIFMAIIRVNSLEFKTDVNLNIVRLVAVLEMVTGAILIIYISARNKKYGIGGQSAIIFVNIISGIINVMGENSGQELVLTLVISLFVMGVFVIMENAEKRIPLQRISIHNIYSDKNYLAIKLNPIGVMPAMFSTAFFMIPQFVVGVLRYIWLDNDKLAWIKENMMLTKPFGVAVYVFILYVMTIVFSRIMINPSEYTEQFLKSGDSICDIHAGKDTKRYLSKVIMYISFTSATVMSICLCLPLLLQLKGIINSSLMMLPSSIMMLTGIGCNLYNEVKAVNNLEAYKQFI